MNQQPRIQACGGVNRRSRLEGGPSDTGRVAGQSLRAVAARGGGQSLRGPSIFVGRLLEALLSPSKRSTRSGWRLGTDDWRLAASGNGKLDQSQSSIPVGASTLCDEARSGTEDGSPDSRLRGGGKPTKISG